MVCIDSDSELTKVSGDFAELAADAGYILEQGIEALLLVAETGDVSNYIEAFLNMLVMSEDNLLIRTEIELGAIKFVSSRIKKQERGVAS